MPLLRALLAITFAERDDDVPRSASEAVARAGPGAWRHAMRELTGHRLSPMLAFRLRQHDLEHLVPTAVHRRLVEAYQRTLFANSMACRGLADLLGRLAQRGIEPIVMKGLVVADDAYPDIGCRPMVDLDLLVTEAEAADTERTLLEFGFVRPSERLDFLHAEADLAVDLHTRFPLFPPETRAQLVERRPAPDLGIESLATWEPNAQVVHLVTHLHKHRRVLGISLLWILDIALLVRVREERLSIERLRALFPDERYLELLWQILAFVERECGAPPPDRFRAEIDGRGVLSLPWILRQRRLRGWGFPRRRFPIRFAARCLGLRPLGRRQWLRWSDIPLGLVDCVFDRSVRR